MARTIAKDHDQKRSQILKTAAQVFATEGFDRASMSQLATACGISKANIYHYYSGKDALLFDILDTYLKALRDRICGVDLTGLSAEERLHAVILETLMAYEGSDHEHRIQTRRFGIMPQEQQVVLREYQRELIRLFSDIVLAISPETFTGDTGKLRATTMSIFGMLNWFYMWNPNAGPQDRTEYAELVTNLTLKGISGV